MTKDDMLKELLRGLLAEGWRIHARLSRKMPQASVIS